jgi:hypothetical protein
MPGIDHRGRLLADGVITDFKLVKLAGSLTQRHHLAYELVAWSYRG